MIPKSHFYLLLFLACVGCHSYSTYKTPQNYNCSPQQLALIQMDQRVQPKACDAISTTWTNSQRSVFPLLNKLEFNFKGRGNLLIAEYGKTNGGIVFSLDFYWEKQTGDGQYELFFLKHDYFPGRMVTSIDPWESRYGDGVMTITREWYFDTSKHEMMSYQWQWRADHTMTIDPEIGYGEISSNSTNTSFQDKVSSARERYRDYYSDERYKRLIREGHLNRSSFYPDGSAEQRDLLIMAVERGDTNVLAKLLLAAPALVHKSDILVWASYTGNTNILAMLHPCASDLNRHINNRGITPLHVARNAATADFLFHHGAEIDTTEDTGQTPLMYAAKVGNLGLAEFLITKGASLKAIDNNGSTPLYIAVESDQTNLVNLLLSRGAAPLKPGPVEQRPEIYIGFVGEPSLDFLFPDAAP